MYAYEWDDYLPMIPMRKFIAIISLLSASISVFSKDLEQISLECVGPAIEVRGTVTQNLDEQPRQKYQNFVRYYQLSQNEIIEHSSSIPWTITRKEIESKDDSIRTHQGFYTITPDAISYLEMTGYKKFMWNSFRSFSINRRTGAWELSETSRGGLGGEIDGARLLTANGFCRPWDSKSKF